MMCVAIALSCSRSWSFKTSRYFKSALVGCSVGHYIRRCSWVSSCWPQYLHTSRWLLSLCWFFWLVLAASILALVLIMALYCFLVSFSMYCGLFPIGVEMFSAQCFVFDFVWASFLISSLYFSLFMWSMIFFSISFDIWRCFSSRWYSFIISLIIFFHRLFLSDVMRFVSESSLFSSLWACIIFFLFMVYFMGSWPVSASRMLVGVPWGSARIVFNALLWIVVQLCRPGYWHRATLVQDIGNHGFCYWNRLSRNCRREMLRFRGPGWCAIDIWTVIGV